VGAKKVNAKKVNAKKVNAKKVNAKKVTDQPADKKGIQAKPWNEAPNPTKS
jgi:hypothetical protein